MELHTSQLFDAKCLHHASLQPHLRLATCLPGRSMTKFVDERMTKEQSRRATGRGHSFTHRIVCAYACEPTIHSTKNPGGPREVRPQSREPRYPGSSSPATAPAFTSSHMLRQVFTAREATTVRDHFFRLHDT